MEWADEEAFVLQWEAIEHADGYQVDLSIGNHGTSTYTKQTTYDLSEIIERTSSHSQMSLEGARIKVEVYACPADSLANLYYISDTAEISTQYE